MLINRTKPISLNDGTGQKQQRRGLGVGTGAADQVGVRETGPPAERERALRCPLLPLSVMAHTELLESRL